MPAPALTAPEQLLVAPVAVPIQLAAAAVLEAVPVRILVVVVAVVDILVADTVVVSVKVQEGDRTRLQAFEGVVMNIKKAGLNSAFIVRKISSGIGVERTFQMHSPLIDSISVKRKGDVRQATLYYLRERSGRSARIKERLD